MLFPLRINTIKKTLLPNRRPLILLMEEIVVDKITNMFMYTTSTRKITNLQQLPEWISSKCVGLSRIDDDIALLLKDGSYLRCGIDDCIIGNGAQLEKMSSSYICTILNTFEYQQSLQKDYPKREGP
ncbi:hypothetical protein [Commensalibacter communis]|nr:hypothetical protein [Commensalibacter communis]CAI3933862.1 unnamed protein product [Commensalibacter communis]CAI3942190.1 unnamed protein product [Commensalibacter communis]CAI3944347.1 unnamed protein product [Commensalibacter communis]CAI3944453.1 unnamed protein product [Commensalibacter communis]